jgi:endo-1,4-beta-xylanase
MEQPIHRRAVLAGMLATAAVMSFGRTSAAEGEVDLRALADSKGIGFGSAVDGKMLKDPAYKAQLIADCNTIVPRNALKWSATERSPGKFGFGEADAILNFAESNGMAMRGHTLVWHNLPKWVTAIDDAAELEAAMTRHVETIASRYAGRISSWDVVNEPLEYGEAVLRPSPFMKLMGEEYIGKAFEVARAADPAAQLVLNETHLSKEGEKFAARRKLMLEVIGRLQDRNVPIDAIGIQGHFNPGLDKLDHNEFGAFCRELKARGLKVLITELDASCRFVTRIEGYSDETYAPPFRDLIEVAAAEGDLTAVVVWGLSARGVKPNEPDGPNKGCKVRINLYDAEDRPLPTRAAVAEALQSL